MRLPIRYLIAATALLVGCGAAAASGAAFKITAPGAELGKPEDPDAEIPKYRVKLKVGETVTLVAEGIVMPRGGGASPGDIDAGAWLFDDEAFKLVPAEKAKADKTKAVVALTGSRRGRPGSDSWATSSGGTTSTMCSSKWSGSDAAKPA